MRKDKPSMTARKVALSIVTLGTDPVIAKVLPADLVDATAEMLVASGAVSPSVMRLARWRKMISIYMAFDWMLPGQFEAFGQRKAFCEQQVRDGIRSGATQALVLGAGYDTLCWRLSPKFPDVSFFEIDHPATAVLKAKGVRNMGERENLNLLAEDLGKRKLIDVITENEVWDQKARTVIIAEGLVMYLSPEAVEELFCQCGEVVGKGSRIAFSYIPMGTDGLPFVGRWTGLMLWLQKVVGEPWLWSVAPDNIDEFLRKTGWIVDPNLAESRRKIGVEYLEVAIK